MDRKESICITHNQAFIIGFSLLILGLVLFANYVNTLRLSSRSRASAADLQPASSFSERARTITAACKELKGYLAWSGKDSVGSVIFDRFTGRYYSLDQVNPVVTPPADKPLAGHCAASGKPVANWCKSIVAEPACKADCVWISKGNCKTCAPKGVDANLICPR